MSYSSAHEYTPVSTSDVAVDVPLQDPVLAVVRQVHKSGRVVATVCLLQMFLAALSLYLNLDYSFMGFLTTAIFTSFGLTGVIKARHQFVAVHFVFSVVVYVLVLVGVVLLVVNANCDFFTYWVFFLLVLIQAIGLKHSRILIQSLRILEDGVVAEIRQAEAAATPSPSAPAAEAQQAQQTQQAQQAQQVQYAQYQAQMDQMMQQQAAYSAMVNSPPLMAPVYPMMYPAAGQQYQGVPMMTYPYMQFSPVPPAQTSQTK